MGSAYAGGRSAGANSGDAGSSFRSPGSRNDGVADISGKKLAKSKSKPPLNRARVWRVVAGPDLSEANLIVPLDPEFVARQARDRGAAIAERNRSYPVPPPLIGPSDPPVNVVGGYRFPRAPKISLGADVPQAVAATTVLIATIPGDVSIPPFLRRPFKSGGTS